MTEDGHRPECVCQRAWRRGVDSCVNPRDPASTFRRVHTGVCAWGECEGGECTCV